MSTVVLWPVVRLLMMTSFDTIAIDTKYHRHPTLSIKTTQILRLYLLLTRFSVFLGASCPQEHQVQESEDYRWRYEAIG